MTQDPQDGGRPIPPRDSNTTDAERRSLARCWECFDDGQDTDVGIPMLKRLTELGWLEKQGRNRWAVTAEGDCILNEMGVPT